VTDGRTDGRTESDRGYTIHIDAVDAIVNLTFAMTKGESFRPPCNRSPYGGPPDIWKASS